jgi:antitoxin FitA
MNLSIKDVSAEVAARLRERAARNRRSLQGELLVIVEQAALGIGQVAQADSPFAGPATGAPRRWKQGWKTIDQLLAERRATGWTPSAALATAPLGVDIVRVARDTHRA